MSAMSAVKPKQTLRGLFPVPPKTNCRRDFLRENKLSVRDLQRVTPKSQTSQQQLHPPRVNRSQHQISQVGRQTDRTQTQLNHQQTQQKQQHLQQHQRTSTLLRNANAKKQPVWNAGNASRAGSFSGDNRRITASKNSVGRTLTSVCSRTVSCHKEIQTEDIHDEQFLYDALKKCTSYELNTRANGLNDNRKMCSDPNMPLNGHYARQSDQPEYFAKNEQQHALSMHGVDACDDGGSALALPLSGRSQASKMNGLAHECAEHELPLTARSRVSTLTMINDGIGQYPETNGQRDRDQRWQASPRSNQQPYHNAGPDAESVVNEASLSSIRSRVSKFNDLINKEDQQTHQPLQKQHRQEHNDDELNNNICSLSLDTKEKQKQPMVGEQLLSTHSRHTECSNAPSQHCSMMSKKPTRSSCSLHTVGSREDLLLPRYLEREKREKQAQRMREMNRDPNCPLGHIALTDEERQTEVTMLEKQFKMLIDELNHMPMTTETLRIRVRKAEIEKELVLLEAKIRLFSKSKVYVATGTTNDIRAT